MKAKVVVSLLLTLFFLGSFRAPMESTEEYSIKAAFIYKFTNYIEWPGNVPGNEFVIGIIGPSPIRNMLTEIANTKTIKGKKIVIRQYESAAEIGSCHILFISARTSQPLDEILANTGKGTLTISEKAGYAA